VEAFADYSLSGIWYWLKRNRIGLRSPQLKQWSPDPEYVPKKEYLLACLRLVVQQPGEVELVFLDEMGYHRWPDAARLWWPVWPAPAAVVGGGGGNNTQWRIIGALNARSGQVNYLDNYIVGRRQLIQMYAQLAEAYPEAKRLLVVEDNWSIHQHADVMEALQAWPQIEPVWLPTYSPWLNPIEKLWRWLRQDVLKLHRSVEDWPGLRRQVRQFLDQFSEGSSELLRYVGLQGEGLLAQALRGP
jgi:transposase